MKETMNHLRKEVSKRLGEISKFFVEDATLTLVVRITTDDDASLFFTDDSDPIAVSETLRKLVVDPNSTHYEDEYE